MLFALIPLSALNLNRGGKKETLDITACYNNTVIEAKIVGNPAAGATPPKANFTYFPEPPLVYQIMTFNASSSKPNGGNIVSYEWDFGDGVTETYVGANLTNTATHVYTAVGPYTVNLTVTDSEGLNDTESKQITVLQEPTAIFTFEPKSLLIGETVAFNASASYDEDGYIVSWKWDFDGDDIIDATGEVIEYAYTSAGTYSITLTVTDNQGLTDIATDTVTVSGKHDVAVVNVTPHPSKVTVGEIVSINVTVANQGTEKQTFNITVYYDNTIIETRSITNLAPDTSETLTINWETTNVDPDTYIIKAATGTITDDINATNNEIIDGTVTVQEAPSPGILLYVAAGVAIIIVVAIAFYLLRIRKPKPA